MDRLNQINASTIVATITTTIGVLVWLYICIKLAQRRGKRDGNYRFGFAVFALAVTVWYAIGYYIILFGSGVDTAYYFRPATSFLIMMSVVSGLGMLERNDDKDIIDKLKKQNTDLMHELEKCTGIERDGFD